MNDSSERFLMNALLEAADALDKAWCFAGAQQARQAVIQFLKDRPETIEVAAVEVKETQHG